jgi:hypothetical protein
MTNVNYQFPPSYLPNANYISQEFFGHGSTIDRVVESINNQKNICLTGLRRIGRTWFLKHLEHKMTHDPQCGQGLLVLPVIDLQKLQHFGHKEAADKIAQQLVSALRERGWIGPGTPRFGNDSWEGLIEAFEFFAPIIKREGLVVVLLLDELEALVKIGPKEQTADELKSDLGDKLHGIVELGTEYRLVGAAHVSLREIMSDNHKIFTTFAFGGIDESATKLLLKSREQAKGIAYSDEALHRAYALTNGHPSFLRIMGEHFSHLHGAAIVSAHVDQAFMNVLQSQHATLTDYYTQGMDKHHQSILTELAIDPTKTKNDLLAKLGATLAAPVFSEHYNDLLEMGLLISTSTAGIQKPCFANELLKAYVKELNGLQYTLP